jgi:hypothetical protein
MFTHLSKPPPALAVIGSATRRLFNNFLSSGCLWCSQHHLGFGFLQKPRNGLEQKKEAFMPKVKQEKQAEQIKRGLAFVPFYRLKKTKNGSQILVYLNAGSAISISIKYLLKVLENQGEG